MTENLLTSNTTDLRYLAEYLTLAPKDSKVFLGCDSERHSKNGVWYADYSIVVVVHKSGNNGCKVFGKIERERDYDQKEDKPTFRLMNEIYKISAFYLEHFNILEPFSPEIHLDINPNEEYASSAVVSQAVGFIRGSCGLEPCIKPRSWAASTAADRFAYIQGFKTKKEVRKAREKIRRKAKRKKAA